MITQTQDLSAQDIFDTVARHLFAQGVRSEKRNGICAYRGKRGLKCAVGVLIPDDIYDPAMDDRSDSTIYGIVREWRDALGFLAPHTSLLSDLQEAHDYHLNWQTTEDMREALRTVANGRDLNPAILDTLSFKDR